MPVKIAIFEDNDRLRESLAYLLKMNNYEIVGDYSQCTEAANIARVYQPDVVLMDIDMPGQSGIKGVALIKEARPDTAVIMYTVFEDDEKLETKQLILKSDFKKTDFYKKGQVFYNKRIAR